MEIYLVAKDELEAQGIRWMIESHFTAVVLTRLESVEALEASIQKQKPDLIILDMDRWKDEGAQFEGLMHHQLIRWLFISSERMFQTAYRALRFRAEDVLFRPFSPDDLIKHIQQIRFHLRNHQQSANEVLTESLDPKVMDYSDLFLTDREYEHQVTMVAFLTPDAETLPLVYQAVQRYSFTGFHEVFALANFILCVQETKEKKLVQEEYYAFLTDWKKKMDEPLAIVMKTASKGSSLKKTYQETTHLTRRIFFEGYDIIIEEREDQTPLEMDPFLTPLEQRQWIKMLERREIPAIREWLEQEFLTFTSPYPDPEIIRIRLTSVLAQIRRHMKSYNLVDGTLEAFYHKVFQQIIHTPVVYQIVQELLAFTTELLGQNHEHLQEGSRTFVEKARELIESNYWDAQWSLEDCAEALRMNKSTLSRRFKAESGQAFRETLHHIRIREAKKLLKETDLSLEEISRLTGYSHQSYFNAKFKLIEDCTPTMYRSGA
ncbi:helix-turn-helix domain-containing protein [Alkalihalophilus lindianensis]|uniref:Helix-turn-helix domain-containing protein n=1 Tax=Alkalihalophilus lindianensis TaxID=1630542 RepID=A0ABU3X4J8_9BACI|nr:helix-turn-helix domain-containing protein [Alkalihalophilus lindianensis]MDV2682819.1 helix-turn-helix domain-containing protein [Alkalihalophilus lindianensis]